MMSEPQIFLDSVLPLERIVPTLEQLLELRFARSDEEPPTYDYGTDELGLHLYEHDYENDRNLPLESYRYCIDVAGGPTHADVDREARRVFETLRSSRLFRLALVDEVQELIATFEPGDAAPSAIRTSAAP